MPIGKARFRISEYNERRKADVRGKERNIRMVSLSLTSMVDMFAVLVIFLLTNSDSVTQWVDLGHGIDLPKASYMSPPPKRGATLQISKEGVFAEQTPVVTVADLLKGPELNPTLKTFLNGRKLAAEDQNVYLNLVGDAGVPFGAIRKIIATAHDSGFNKLNLAIQPK